MLFVGLDLAWSERNGSGVAVLEGDAEKVKFRCGEILYSNKEILNYLQKIIGPKPTLIAIDAPLIVPNETGRRLAEKLVGYLFSKYDAGAFPANRKRLGQWSGKVRGEEISKLLLEAGFFHNPRIKQYEEARKFFEVFPHPSMVVLFNLNRIIRYKAKPKRNYEFRWRAFEKYQRYLKKLENGSPKLILPKSLVEKKVRGLKAKALKDYEDLLDAVFCGYIAAFCWSNPQKCEVLGNMKEGYILTPIFEGMKKELTSLRSQRMLKEFLD